PPSSARSSIVAAASTRLGQPPEAIEEALYGDLPGERRLAPLPHPPSVSELLERYNLTLAQSLLLRAESVQAQMDGLAKAVLRYARLQQLICTVEAPSEGSGRATIHLSGPLSLFRGTTKYGRALACWLPALSRAPSWSLRATCLLGAGPVVFAASHRDPIGTTHVAVRRFDSKVEERFFRDLQRLGSRWVVLREADPVGAGARLVCPDFTLIDAGRGLRVAVEIVGFWTPAYLRDKVATLAALPPGTRWLLCVDAALAAAEVEALPRLAPVFPFRGRIPAAEFLAFVERAVGAWTTRSPCDHPRSP
ncbi:MAG: DUF790 family protein, partial [Deltaproteobacteria bacterium]|nr:DUF790 family protein [Deltaproteobacteria bacterium]